MIKQRDNNLNILSVIVIIILVLQCSYGAKAIVVPSPGITTITEALVKAKSGDTVWVSNGVYKEHLTVQPGVILASRELFKAVIDGKGRGEVITIASESTIMGLEIRNGNAGIISRGKGNTIKKCKIYKNRGSGIICMGDLPLIENNIIVYNGGSGIQALDIRTGAQSINHNTIAYNTNNGITFNGNAAISIENNIIASNYARGLKIEPVDHSVTITHNNLYSNHRGQFTVLQENFSFDPLFSAPKRRSLDFSLQSTSKAIKRGNDNKNLGILFD